MTILNGLAWPAGLTTLAFALSLGGCGGGSGDAGGTAAGSTLASRPATDAAAPSSAPTMSSTPVSAAPLAAITVPDASQPILTTPANIANGSVIELACGRTYQGTLDLKGKSNVTVKTSGTCGKATLVVGQEITGWTQHQDNVYSAPIPFAAAQVLIDGQPIATAHWPSRAQTWAKAEGSSASMLSYPMPNADLTGATLVFRPHEWAVEARRITAYSGGTMSLAKTGNPNYDGYALSGTPEFYVEGKLWMLDEPGEWAISDGKLYVWTPDGQSPEGRAWAAPDRHGIDAANSRGISIDGVRIFGTTNGINAPDAANLNVTGVDIVNSSGNGIMNSGGSALTVDRSSVRNSRHDGIVVKWGGGSESIRNSSIEATGVTGMPVNTHGAIVLTLSSGAKIVNNSVTNSGYIGIRFFRNATVAQNTVDGACLVLIDCGGLYTMAEDRQPLNSLVEGNTIRNVGRDHRHAWAVNLDENSNAVTVADNNISGSYNGMLIHNGFNNTIKGNTFSKSRQSHIQMVESGSAARVVNNAVTGNRFAALDGEETYRVSSDLGTGAVARFAAYDGNTYANSSPAFANFNGELLNFSQWRRRTGQDGSSTMVAP
ncbi:MAG: right-handed parallel beta-helix repeat-containing protein [Noviherbaspirillum sp.]|nr:right-handed parallel beta-helix repeat-containing protein [Noviherbaspirillum sp.]